MNRGFTLFETVIYVALFSIIMTGTIVTAFELIKSSDSLNEKVMVQEEGNFLMRKLSWAFSGISPTIPPLISGSGCDKSIYISRTVVGEDPIEIETDVSGKVAIKVAGGSFVPLTTNNVEVTCLQFEYNSTKKEIVATSTINGIEFTTSKYIR